MGKQSPNVPKQDKWSCGLKFQFDGDDCVYIGKLPLVIDPKHLRSISTLLIGLAWLMEQENKHDHELDTIREKLRKIGGGYE